MIQSIDPKEMPSVAGNQFYLDYIAGDATALSYFAHSPRDFRGALEARREYPYPRADVSRVLYEYNAARGAHDRSLENVEALKEPNVFCVVTGQQAGFVGGPMYTAYKIINAIRLAEHLTETLGARVVPIFWLATEDHDFAEINHTYYLKQDGEIGSVKFEWEEEGRPVADLFVDENVAQAYQEYLDNILPGPHFDQVQEWFTPRLGERFGDWLARTWLQLFSEWGLVVVEPRILRAAGAGFLQWCMERSDDLQRSLDDVAARLNRDGYVPMLDTPGAGVLFTFDDAGQRVRVEDPIEHIPLVREHPERYSTDAALRPLFADVLLPVVASILGPGETAYTAMLKPLYDLYGVPQPLIFPRQSYTIVAASEADRIEGYQTSVREILCERLDMDQAFNELIPAEERALFVQAKEQIEAALQPLRPYLEDIDPSLGRTWEQTLGHSLRNMEKLEERAFRAKLSQQGFSRGELRTLCNVLLPRGRPQERVFPMPHFVNRYGLEFVDLVFAAGDLGDFRHHVVFVEDSDASG